MEQYDVKRLIRDLAPVLERRVYDDNAQVVIVMVDTATREKVHGKVVLRLAKRELVPGDRIHRRSRVNKKWCKKVEQGWVEGLNGVLLRVDHWWAHSKWRVRRPHVWVERSLCD